MESSAAGSLGSTETIDAGGFSCRILSGSMGSETSSSSCHAGILWLLGSPDGILIPSNHGKIGISTN